MGGRFRKVASARAEGHRGFWIWPPAKAEHWGRNRKAASAAAEHGRRFLPWPSAAAERHGRFRKRPSAGAEPHGGFCRWLSAAAEGCRGVLRVKTAAFSGKWPVRMLLIRLPDTVRTEMECRENSPALQRWEPESSEKQSPGRDGRSVLPSLTGHCLFPHPFTQH